MGEMRHTPQSQLRTLGSENGNTRAGGYAGESFLCAGFAMCEAIAANHNRNQACHLRNGSGEEGLQRGEACVKRRARLRVSSYGKEQECEDNWSSFTTKSAQPVSCSLRENNSVSAGHRHLQRPARG